MDIRTATTLKPKVILVGPVYPYRGGIAHHTQFLDEALRQSGCQTQVVSFARQYPAWLYPGVSDQDPSQKTPPANAHYLLDPFYPWTWLRAVRAITAMQPGLVIIQWWTTFWSIPFAYLARALKRRSIPVIFILHNVFPHEQRPWDAWLARLALSAADALAAQTEQEKNRLLSLLPDAAVETCPMPMFPLPAAHLPDRATARRELRIPENAACLLFFGIVRPYKGLRYLIEALGSLNGRGVTPHLIVAGEFWEDKNRYLQQIAALQLEEQIHIFDRYIPDEQVGGYFAAADLFVAPYTHGTTQSAAAALARGFGAPMIITEEVQRGLDAAESTVLQVVPAGDAAALAQAIQAALETLAQQPAAARRQPAENQPRAAEEWQRFARSILKLIPSPHQSDLTGF